MNEIQELMNDIEKLRNRLNNLINENHENLTDKDVVAASQMLNALLNQYNKFLDEKMK